MIRSVLTLLIALCVLARAAWPALPTYVCAGMGVRLQAPCCPEEEGPSDTPVWAARCCQPEGPERGDAQAPPPAPQRPELAAALVLLPGQGISIPPPPRFQPPPSARAHSGVPPPLHGHHVVLRI
jgi:hypothetical protein